MRERSRNRVKKAKKYFGYIKILNTNFFKSAKT